MKLLFICTGNTCRSPMAEALTWQLAERLGLDVQATSAGISAEGSRVSTHAAQVMLQRGIDIALRRPVQLHKALVQDCDYALTMTERQAEYLRGELPEYAARIMSMGRFLGTDEEVEDPYGGDITAYEACACQLEDMLRRMLIDDEK